MMEIKAPEAQSNLGERLLAGVRNLWRRVQAIEKVADHQGIEIEQIKVELKRLQSEVRGLKISRGHARAKNSRLSKQLAEAERLLPQIENRIIQ
jgi:hypothetical protein